MFIKYVVLVIKRNLAATASEPLFHTVYVRLNKSKEVEVFDLSDDPSEAYVTGDKDEAFILSKRFGGHMVTHNPVKEEKDFWWMS